MLSMFGAARSFALFVVVALVASPAFADPPLRVLRLSYVSGAVSFNAAGTDDWVAAPLNRPVVYGDQVWADADGRGELALGQATLWMGPRTSVRVLNLDDRTAQFELAQGTVSLRVRRVSPDDTLEIDTPNLAFVVTQPGRYRVSVDEQGEATVVAARDGSADVYGGRSSYVVGRGQTYRFYGTDLADSERLPPPAMDAFERFAQERDRRFEGVASSRYVSTDVIGYEDLDRYGAWSTVPEYGNVWYPRDVGTSWVPYREGHWSWVDPWGWTWVDDAPWGFAPFHYGRWIYARDRWGWVPGPTNVRPVYGPAFVAFVDAGNVRVSGGGGGPSIGWFPLGPREVYRPSYAASAQYVRQVNVSNTVITNVTVLNNIIANPSAPQVNTYVNLRAPNAVTAVPPAAMAQAQTVTRIATVIPGSAIQASHIQPYARVAPAAQAMVGPARPAQGKPPVQVETRPVVARNAPPPPPAPVSQRLPGLQQNPGKPTEVRPAAPPAPVAGAPRSAGGTAAPTAAVPPSNVRVVSAPKPAATAAPPAKAPDASRANAPKPPSTGAPETASAPNPPGAPPTARPAAPPGRPDNAAENARGPGGPPARAPERPAAGAPAAAAPAATPASPGAPPGRAAESRPAGVPPPGTPPGRAVESRPAGGPPPGTPPGAPREREVASPPTPAAPAPQDNARAREGRATPPVPATEPGGRAQGQPPRTSPGRERATDTPEGPALLPRTTPAPVPRAQPVTPPPPASGAPPSAGAPAAAAPARLPENRAPSAVVPPPPPPAAARPVEPRAPTPAPAAPAATPQRPAETRAPPPSRPPEKGAPEKAAPEKAPPGQADKDKKDKDKEK